jgi:hypothetical protein
MGHYSPLTDKGKVLKIIVLGATLFLLLPLAGGCRGRPQVQGAAPPPEKTPTVTLPLDQLYVLETWGAPPVDTVVAFKPGGRRTIVLHHAPPDNTEFAELSFPASLIPDSTRDSVHVTLAARPGVYGLTITSSLDFAAGATLTFKYPVHFAAPTAASQKYGNPALFERALGIGHRESDGRFRLLPSTRPAADNLMAAIPGPGVYLVAAPR